jgi:ABC-2 type transport system ATP-binding protein
VGYCPDDPVLYDKMSGIRFLAFIADVFGVPAERRAARIQKLAETFEMKVALGDRVGIISRGELAAAAPLEELRRKAGEESATLEKLFLEMTDENPVAR